MWKARGREAVFPEGMTETDGDIGYPGDALLMWQGQPLFHDPCQRRSSDMRTEELLLKGATR